MLNLAGGGYQRPQYKEDWDYTLESIHYPADDSLTVEDIPTL